MSQGWTGSDEKTSRDPGDSADVTTPTPPPGQDEHPFDSLATDINTPSSGFRNPHSDQFSTDVQTPAPSSGDRGHALIEPGVTIFGKYLVLERLGKGGMGEVWLVKDAELDVKRALKLITQGTAFNAEARIRFRREARAMARFTHPNVVAVHDSRLDNHDVAYIVMEYVPGQSLEKIIRPGHPRSLEWTLHILTQLCDALQEAHAQGIIHRDLKPSNLILVNTASRQDVLKVLDFGIAKILHVEDNSQDPGTIAGTFVGTPPYASPEQASGMAVPVSDIYSVGVILYEFLTGSRPFTGRPQFLIASTMFSQPPTFAEVNAEADVPPEIEQVVMRCLAKNPEDRPQSAMELLRDFKSAMPTLEYVPEAKIPDTVMPGGARPPRKRLAIAAVALALVAVVVILALVLPAMLRSTGKKTDLSASNTSVKPDIAPTVPKDRPAQLGVDGRSFSLWKGRFYLPTGYEPADQPELASDGWPIEIVRKDDGVKFLRIPGGKLQMGARDKPEVDRTDADSTNQPAHEVVVKGFYIQKHEVTNGEMLAYEAKYGKGFADPSALSRWREQYDGLAGAIDATLALKHPAQAISWSLAADFARRKSARLPTEAQWEYAARSGESSRVLVWDEENDRNFQIDKLANLYQSDPKNGVWTAPVGEYPKDRTRQGILDMAGNLREWCRDPWVAYDDQSARGQAPAPESPTPDTVMVLRGGSFLTDSDFKFVTHRGKGLRISEPVPPDVGFRLVIECPE